MTIDIKQPQPTTYTAIDHATLQCGFTMASDGQTCSLLRTLAASKRAGRFLELGTDTGLSTSWILDGMDEHSTLVSVDNAPEFLAIARQWLGADDRLTLVESDGGAWIEANKGQWFDYIFADTWHGKYLMLEEALGMLNPGGFFILDDIWVDAGHRHLSADRLLCAGRIDLSGSTKRRTASIVSTTTSNSAAAKILLPLHPRRRP